MAFRRSTEPPCDCRFGSMCDGGCMLFGSAPPSRFYEKKEDPELKKELEKKRFVLILGEKIIALKKKEFEDIDAIMQMMNDELNMFRGSDVVEMDKRWHTCKKALEGLKKEVATVKEEIQKLENEL